MQGGMQGGKEGGREGAKKGKSLCASLPPHQSKGEMSLSKGGECFPTFFNSETCINLKLAICS